MKFSTIFAFALIAYITLAFAHLADARASGSKRSLVLSKNKRQANNNIAAIRKKNADDAEALQKTFKSNKAGQSCKANVVTCAGAQLAQCANGKLVTSNCNTGTVCSALPLVLKSGTSIACTTEADRLARLDQARKNLK